MTVCRLLIILLLASEASAQASSDSARSPATADTQGVLADSGWLTLQSNPAGGEVYEKGVLLGKTPLDRLPLSAGKHVLTIFYPSANLWNSVSERDTLDIASGAEIHRTIEFTTAARYGIFTRVPEQAEKNPGLFLNNGEEENSRVWKSYAAGATMILSGALSAYLKTHSDNEFDNYIATGDPQYLSTTRRLDKWAGVTLFISEISFGYLTYLLLSE
ncbi:MAG TPA: PEGA domain-containing protein [Bacteroidota bacterium]